MPQESPMQSPHKEPAIYGRIFNHLEEVRAAVAAFVVTYNDDWPLEELGCLQQDKGIAAV